MFTLPKKTCPVRSYWTPGESEKSPVKITFAQGPGQSAGGVKLNVWLLKSAKAWLVSNVTSQCFVGGRGTRGSAVTSSEVPLVVIGGYTDALDWAKSGKTVAAASTANSGARRHGRRRNDVCIDDP